MLSQLPPPVFRTFFILRLSALALMLWNTQIAILLLFATISVDLSVRAWYWRRERGGWFPLVVGSMGVIAFIVVVRVLIAHV